MSEKKKEEKKSFRLATRSSPLATIQADSVRKLLLEKGFHAVLKELKTEGDRVQDKPLSEIGGKGLFIKELEVALLEGEADVGIHSLKDLPCRLEDNFELVAHLPRDFPHDVIVVKKASRLDQIFEVGKNFLRKDDLSSLPAFDVATGSLRRESLLRNANSLITVLPIRGNIGTRLKKLDENYAEALILSEASLLRMPYDEKKFQFYRLDPSWFVPCAGQGVVVVEALKKTKLDKFFESLSSFETLITTHLERGVLEMLGGSCLLPIGVYCRLKAKVYHLDIFIGDKTGEEILTYEKEFSRANSYKEILKMVKKDLYEKDINKVLRKLGLAEI